MAQSWFTPQRMVLVLLLAAVGWLGLSVPHWVRVAQAAQLYLYGYPLVMMGVTKDVMTTPLAAGLSESERKEGSGPVNQLFHVARFPDHTFRDVVAPNADTLYSIAWLDLREGPLVLHMPDMQGRWVLMQVLDAWTNAFASLGTRAYGGAPRSYLFTGPGWSGSVPQGMVHVPSPTRIAWMIGRTYTRDEADFPNVHRLQAQYRLEPFGPRATVTFTADKAPSPDPGLSPLQQVARMDAAAFYARLLPLMAQNPPPDADRTIIDRMTQLGLTPGAPWRWDALRPQDQRDLREGMEWARGLFDAFAPGSQGTVGLTQTHKAVLEWAAVRIRKAAMNSVNGWAIPLELGSYGTDYPLRALTALLGLGANRAVDAVYPSTTVDAQGEGLDGRHRYRLHFSAAEIPPASAFWSLSMYDSQTFFVDNPIRRYVIGDRDALKTNADGSLDIWLQHDAPHPQQQSNWLPAPAGPFKLYLRIYDPKPEVLDGTWKPPAVQRVPGDGTSR